MRFHLRVVARMVECTCPVLPRCEESSHAVKRSPERIWSTGMSGRSRWDRSRWDCAPSMCVPGSPKPAYKDAVRRESVLVASAWQAAGVRLFNLDHQLAESEEKSAHMSRRSGPSSRGRSMRRSRFHLQDFISVAEACEGRGSRPRTRAVRQNLGARAPRPRNRWHGAACS